MVLYKELHVDLFVWFFFIEAPLNFSQTYAKKVLLFSKTKSNLEQLSLHILDLSSSSLSCDTSVLWGVASSALCSYLRAFTVRSRPKNTPCPSDAQFNLFSARLCVCTARRPNPPRFLLCQGNFCLLRHRGLLLPSPTSNSETSAPTYTSRLLSCSLISSTCLSDGTQDFNAFNTGL